MSWLGSVRLLRVFRAPKRVGGWGFISAVWHGLFNIATATAAGSGTVAAVVSTLVIAQALVLLGLELRAAEAAGRPCSPAEVPAAPRPTSPKAPAFMHVEESRRCRRTIISGRPSGFALAG